MKSVEKRLELRQYDILAEEDEEMFEILSAAIKEVGFKSQMTYLETMPKPDYLKAFKKHSSEVAEFYFQLGKLYFRRQVPSARLDNME